MRKKIFAFLFVLVGILLLASCVKNTKKQSGETITQTYEAKDADRKSVV